MSTTLFALWMRDFLEHINSQRPSIEFTMERENDMSLPFMDTLLTRKEDGKLDISV